ncbi:MAG: rhomboid family intramembrane serine protease [Agathobacter sp.]|nr:rhomboid family intramembrane serine protease [Agathobacter sp.]
MSFISRLERKFGKYSITNITKIMVILTLIGYGLMLLSNVNMVFGVVLSMCQFSPSAILHGQIWRLFTWIIVPSTGFSVWSLLFMACLLMLGQNLERGLGTFAMNVYFIGGILLCDIAGLLIYLISGGTISIILTFYYILFSLYLMLGLFMPDAQVNLYFVLPIKMKWLMIVYFLTLGYEVYSYFMMGKSYGNALVIGVAYSAQIILALINLGVFVYCCKSHVSIKQKKRQREYRQAYQQFSEPRPGSNISRHKCCICGRTELDVPSLTFRYCSKCVGNREYCQEHLFTHEHVK